MEKRASLYRMVTQEHICPYGLKSLDLLKRKGYRVEDHKLKSREETQDFKKSRAVDTTPQAYIGDEHIGGYSELRKHFGMSDANAEDKAYAPVIAIFTMTFFMSLAISYDSETTLNLIKILETFIALSMCVLAIQKLRDLAGFSLQFITYDLVAMRFVPYAYIYAFMEAFAGIGMLAKLPAWLVATPAIFIGSVGASSVIKAVYFEKRNLKCACVGGNSKIPLGILSLTENLMMLAMGVWFFVP